VKTQTARVFSERAATQVGKAWNADGLSFYNAAVRSRSRRWLAILIALLIWSAHPAYPQSTDTEIFDTFQTWMKEQPASKIDILDRYRQKLLSDGVAAAEADRRIDVIIKKFQESEKERWNRVLTSPTPAFNTKPNAFLVEMSKGLKPGKALDVGMGQGRNSIYLAQQGWTVTGFDPADKAVAAAQDQAKRLGVTLTTFVKRDDEFDFGRDQWDLILLSYVGARDMVDRVHESLKPGGVVIVEGFHVDATKDGPIGRAVVFETNELLDLFERFRVLRYEDTSATADFGLKPSRIVRLCAQK
jgi:2-polyprenyl-3-methyl-5-hydroxy-6-metoxy-1,4-benzoquinol methylase